MNNNGAAPKQRITLRVVLGIMLLLAMLIMMISYQLVLRHQQHHSTNSHGKEPFHSTLESFTTHGRLIRQQQQQSSSDARNQPLQLPLALQSVLDRARHYQGHCQHVVTQQQVEQPQPQHSKKAVNASRLTNVDLPAFGIIAALEHYATSTMTTTTTPDDPTIIQYEYQCQLPPETECQETQMTVIFMGYNPDRLQMMKHQIHSMLHYSDWQALVYEIVLVWNGPRKIDESKVGKLLLHYQTTFSTKFRIFYPLLEGFDNDLMNRYHPRFQIKTKAILFYDDDGPFYSHAAVLGGFELWKRNANAEIGAMARKIDISARQEMEKKGILNGIGDRFFVSHCGSGCGGSDKVVYNYHFFAQFSANMALPSGSIFHSNYLCWIWHPALAEVRQFVKDHPVHPDDVTVSMIISQLAGRAPKVYSRRINMEQDSSTTKNNEKQEETPNDEGKAQQVRQQRKGRRRRLLLSESLETGNNWNTTTDVDWESQLEEERLLLQHHGRRKLLWEQQDWGKMRREAVNSLVSYFGSLNSGSIGWCYGTPWQVNGGEECNPDQAKIGMLPWMQPDHTPKTTCP
jgi:hypothetical protein